MEQCQLVRRSGDDMGQEGLTDGGSLSETHACHWAYKVHDPFHVREVREPRGLRAEAPTEGRN